MVTHGFVTPAIVLKRTNIGETDRLITLYTRHQGKMGVKAKGVRAENSKRRSHVELFNTIQAQVFEGKSFPILAQTELLKDRSNIKSDLKLLRIAYHLCEVVNYLTPERQPHRDVFDLLDRALSSIDMVIWKQEEKLVYAFEAKLLMLLGFGVPTENKSELHSYIEELVDTSLKSQKILA